MKGNTRYAQGGVAAVWNHETDTFEKAYCRYPDAGDGLCNEEVVRMVVEEGLFGAGIDRLGRAFDKEKSGEYDLGREGGHSENRILHYKESPVGK
jgi:L-aspartate oxidase